MSFSLRTTILATGCFLAIGTSVARAQMPRAFYYPRRATTPRRRGRSTSRPPATTTTSRSTPSRLQPALPRPRGLPTPTPPPTTIPAVGLPRRAAPARSAARMLVATRRTTRTGKPSRRKPIRCGCFRNV